MHFAVSSAEIRGKRMEQRKMKEGSGGGYGRCRSGLHFERGACNT